MEVDEGKLSKLLLIPLKLSKLFPELLKLLPKLSKLSKLLLQPKGLPPTSIQSFSIGSPDAGLVPQEGEWSKSGDVVSQKSSSKES